MYFSSPKFAFSYYIFPYTMKRFLNHHFILQRKKRKKMKSKKKKKSEQSAAVKKLIRDDNNNKLQQQQQHQPTNDDDEKDPQHNNKKRGDEEEKGKVPIIVSSCNLFINNPKPKTFTYVCSLLLLHSMTFYLCYTMMMMENLHDVCLFCSISYQQQQQPSFYQLLA